jgi:hypothetical protein
MIDKIVEIIELCKTAMAKTFGCPIDKILF